MREGEAFAGIIKCEGAVESLQKFGDAVEQCLVEKMQPPGDFLFDRGLFQAQFAGHPQKLDFVAQLIDDCGAFARGPARLLEFDEQAVNAPVFLQHRDAFGFGRMGRDDRTYANRGQLFAKLLRVDAELGRFRDDICEGALHGLVAELILDAPALAHGGVLLNDGEQLKPEFRGPERRAPETPAARSFR